MFRSEIALQFVGSRLLYPLDRESRLSPYCFLVHFFMEGIPKSSKPSSSNGYTHGVGIPLVPSKSPRFLF